MKLGRISLISQRTITILVVRTFRRRLLPFRRITNFRNIRHIRLVSLNATNRTRHRQLNTFRVGHRIATRRTTTRFRTGRQNSMKLHSTRISIFNLRVRLDTSQHRVSLTIYNSLTLLTSTNIRLRLREQTIRTIRVLRIRIRQTSFRQRQQLHLTILRVRLVVTRLRVFRRRLPQFTQHNNN